MSFAYAFLEAFNNIRRNALVVLGAILAVFISLLLMLGTLIFGEIARVNTLQWSEDVRVIAFVSDEFRNVTELQAEVAGWDEVEEVFFVTKSEAYEEGLTLFAGNESFLRTLEADPNLLPASIRVRPKDLHDYGTIVQRLQGSPGISRIATAGPQVEALAGLRDGLRVVFVILSVALGIAAVALIANTIQMAIYARREEIEIMRLVGASNSFIRIPFLLEGILEGLFGGVLATGVAVGVYRIAVDRLTRDDGTLPGFLDIAISNDFLLRWGVITVLFGAVVGAIGSGLSLAAHKYLRT